jgi:hypothetical protein
MGIKPSSQFSTTRLKRSIMVMSHPLLLINSEHHTFARERTLGHVCINPESPVEVATKGRSDEIGFGGKDASLQGRPLGLSQCIDYAESEQRKHGVGAIDSHSWLKE